MKKQTEEEWNRLSSELLTGMSTWRKEHPRATLEEIEDELDARSAALRAQMLQDLAQEGRSQDWSGKPEEERPKCLQCGKALVLRGKHQRKLKTQGGREVKLERAYGSCPGCGGGFFPPG